MASHTKTRCVRIRTTNMENLWMGYLSGYSHSIVAGGLLEMS